MAQPRPDAPAVDSSAAAVPLVAHLQLRALTDARATPNVRRRHSDTGSLGLTATYSPSMDDPAQRMDGGSPDDVASLRQQPLQSRRSRGSLMNSFSSSASNGEASEKRYAEMMERFQVRRVTRSPSSNAGEGDAAVAADSAAPISTAEEAEQEGEAATTAPRPLSRHTSRTRFTELGAVGPAGEVSTTDATVAPSSRKYALGRLPSTLRSSIQSLLVPMSPTSLLFQCRLYVLILVFALHLVTFPVHLAFITPHGFTSHDVGTEGLIDAVLILDFLLMFNTCVEDRNGEIVADRLRIRAHYLRSWFLPDLVSSTPLSIAMHAGSPHKSSTLRLLYLIFDLFFRGIRVFHVTQLAKLHWKHRGGRTSQNLLAWVLYSRYSHLLRIAWIILVVLVIAHYIACGWRLLHPTGELVSTSTASLFDDYVESFYDSLQLLQGQGIEATTSAQNVFASFAVLIGSILLAVMFGHVAILVSNFNANTTSYQRKMESVFAVMSKLQLPVPLRERIHQYYEHLWREYESLDGEIVRFSKDLSHTLELEVVLYKYMDLVMHVPFWRECSPDFQKQLMLHLHVRVYLPDDYVMRRGEVGDEFYMINRGVCELLLGPDSFECSTQPLVDIDAMAPGDSLSSHGHRDDRDNIYAALSSRSAGAVPPTPPRRRHGSVVTAAYSDVVAKSCVPPDVPSRLVQKLTRGQAFGDIALLMNYERTANVRALTYVEMCVLRRADFQTILVRHPKDRKLVVNSILTRTLENNEATGVWCPLKETVRSVFRETDPERAKAISGVHAALLIATAVNTPLEDESIKFGITGGLREQLVALRDQQMRRSAPDAPKPSRATDAGERNSKSMSHSRSDDDGAGPAAPASGLSAPAPLAALLDPLKEQVHCIQDNQDRLVRMMESMQCELSELRRMNRHLLELVSASMSGSASGNADAAAKLLDLDKAPMPRLTRRLSRRLSRELLVDPPETIPEGKPTLAFTRRKSMSASTLSTSRTGDSISSARSAGGTLLADESAEDAPSARRPSLPNLRYHASQSLYETQPPAARPPSDAPPPAGPVTKAATLPRTSVRETRSPSFPNILSPLLTMIRGSSSNGIVVPTAEPATSPTRYADELFQDRSRQSQRSSGRVVSN
ncbi:hypothetical protein P43SY_001503 [Pythium insidiosum]|uniref:Cyclic nucleotide-binding domain-containing protein n=1 Tax=Pythium insidiosum TaxID=114742 RepID=A0AAD5Q615_PYTIN|nr:hypothetical protein P43SY_001503 [Pythium insidiosum]